MRDISQQAIDLEKTVAAAKVIAVLPVSELAPGAIAPPLDPAHASWDVLAPWDDPLASRGGYRVGAGKARGEHQGEPVIEWERQAQNDRAFVIGEPNWREYSLRCRVQALQGYGGRTNDEPWHANARAGLVFRQETVRQYYTFCIENQRRLVLYRRRDDEWHELAAREAPVHEQVVTLAVTLDGDGIHAECPELGVSLSATDTAFPAGLAGFRALGQCRLFELAVAMTPGQQALNDRLRQERVARTAHLSSALPDEEEAGEVALHGGRKIFACGEFAEMGRCDLLFTSPDGLTAETWEGKALWHVPERPTVLEWTADPIDGARRLYALVGERHAGVGSNFSVTGVPITNTVEDALIAINGATGKVEARTALPSGPHEAVLRRYDISANTGRLAGDRATDILVREWRGNGGDGVNLWAYDGALNLRWHRTVEPPYGHHNAVHFFDVNGDGRDEILAGGTLLSADGEVLWQHDRAGEMAWEATFGAGHYDAAFAGCFAGDPEVDPCAFLLGGSAGVYVVDALTGRTRATHRIGHAQWGMPCMVREDLPGTQMMIGTRWGNYGILSLFSGRGDRLWSMQPDYVLQGACPVQWLPDGPQHIWINTSLQGMGLYDGHGRLAKPLAKIRALYGAGTKKPTTVLRRAPGSPDLLGVQVGEIMHLFGPKQREGVGDR